MHVSDLAVLKFLEEHNKTATEFSRLESVLSWKRATGRSFADEEELVIFSFFFVFFYLVHNSCPSPSTITESCNQLRYSFRFLIHNCKYNHIQH